MALYAYCIAERNAFSELSRHRRPMPLAGVTGLFGNQTFLFPAADLAVVVSEHLPEDAARIAGADAQSAARQRDSAPDQPTMQQVTGLAQPAAECGQGPG